MKQDLWNVLGIEPTRDKRAIKRAYAKMGQAFHPEEHPEEFQLLRRAYEDALDYASGEVCEGAPESASGEVCEGALDYASGEACETAQESAAVESCEAAPESAFTESCEAALESASGEVCEAAPESASGESCEAALESAFTEACEAAPEPASEEPYEQPVDRLFEAVKQEQSQEAEQSRLAAKEIKAPEEPARCKWNDELIARGLSEEKKENLEEEEGCRLLFDHIRLLCAIEDQSRQVMANWDSLARDQLFRSYGNSPILLGLLRRWMEEKKEPLSIMAVGGLYRIYGLTGLSQEEMAAKCIANRCFYLFGRELIQLSKDKKNCVLLNSYLAWPASPKPSIFSIKRPSGILIRLLLLLLILLAKFHGAF